MFIIYKVLHGRELAKNGLIALCIAALILCIFGNVEYVSNVNYFTQASLSDSSLRVYWATYENSQRLAIYGRVHSLCTHPMTFGGFLAIIFPVVIAFILLLRKPKNKLLFFIIAFLCVEGIFFSLARSPVISFLGGMLIMLIFMFKGRWIKKNIFILFIIIICLIGIFSTYEPTRSLFVASVRPWKQPKDFGGSTVELRISQLKNSLAYSTQKPLFGYGPGTGWTRRSKVFRPELIRGLESIWMRNLLEIGWFGLISLIFFLLQVVFLLRKSIKFSQDQSNNILAISGIASFAAFLIFSTATGEMGTFNLVFILLPLVLCSMSQSYFLVVK